MEKEDLAKIVEVLKDKDILVISDEIYSELHMVARNTFLLLLLRV